MAAATLSSAFKASFGTIPRDPVIEVLDLVFKLASKEIENKKDTEKTRLSLAADRLSSLERRRNNFERAYLEKQVEIAGYVGEAGNLQDLYSTGQVSKVTADLYKEPLKYYKQTIAATKQEMGVLTPAVTESINTLLKLSQAQNFLTKGIGATFATGATELQKGMWGPEDLTKELFREKYYSDLEEGKLMPAPLETYFEKHELDPGVPEALELKRIEGIETRERVAAVLEQREAKAISQDRMNRYNPMIDKSNLAMISVTTYYRNEADARSKDDQDSMEVAGHRKRVEQFRLGIILDPNQAIALGEKDLDPGRINILSYDELEEIYEKKMENEQTRGLVSSTQSLGATVWSENLRGIDPLDVNTRGVVVPPYNVRDELLAKAYSQYKEYVDGGLLADAQIYQDNISRILGVDLALEGKVRGILREFFRKNYIEGLTGVKGGFDNLKSANLSKSESGVYARWMDTVKNNYGYDILNDKWIYDE